LPRQLRDDFLGGEPTIANPAALFMPFSKSAHHLIGDLHNWVGWTIIVVAASHAGPLYSTI
jgi:hypothetical protein